MSVLPEQPTTPVQPNATHVDVDGTPRHATNNEGKQIHWSEEGVRNFWRWFGESSITDADGRPMVVRHGSASADIDVFDPNKAGSVQVSDWGKGVYFTPSKSAAQYYAVEACSRSGDPMGDELYKQYEATTRRLGSRPMFEWIDFGSKQDSENQAKYLEIKRSEKVWMDHKESFRQANQGHVYDAYLKVESPYHYTYVGITEPDMHMLAIAEQRDGIIIRRESDDDESPHEAIEEIVVFNPAHIKSAVHNTGLFDGLSPSFTDANPAPAAGVRMWNVDRNRLQQLDAELHADANPALIFLDEVTAAYSGQTNHVLSAWVDKSPAGTLQYTVFQEIPSISMIDVPEHCRRKGFGQALVKELQRQFPDTEIEWGMLTPEGSALKQSLVFVPAPTEYAAQFKELEITRATLDGLIEKKRNGTISAEEIDGWNDHHDQESELESLLMGKSAIKHLIDTTSTLSPTPSPILICQKDRLYQIDEALALAEKNAGTGLASLR